MKRAAVALTKSTKHNLKKQSKTPKQTCEGKQPECDVFKCNSANPDLVETVETQTKNCFGEFSLEFCRFWMKCVSWWENDRWSHVALRRGFLVKQKNILVLNKMVCLCRDPFHYVVANLKYQSVPVSSRNRHSEWTGSGLTCYWTNLKNWACCSLGHKNIEK